MEFQKKTIPMFRSIKGKENLPYELIEWLRGKELSVRQSKDLLAVTKNLIDEAWRTEEEKTII